MLNYTRNVLKLDGYCDVYDIVEDDKGVIISETLIKTYKVF